MGKVMLVTGEVSGDMHAARVVKAIKELAPETEFFGMGSTYLAREGVRLVIDPTEISTIGFSEAFSNIRTHLANLRVLKGCIRKAKPDLIFLVDNSGFNMLMARIARRANIPVVNYFSPSAWAWGRWRANWMARYKAVIAAVFPMEATVYRQAGARVEFVGHPLLDIAEVRNERAEIFTRLELNPEQPVIGLFPGSRWQEIERLLPELLQAAEMLQAEQPDYQFVLSLASGIDQNQIAEFAANYNLILKLVDHAAYQVMKIADLIIVASGTATLEAAILGTPMIIVYQVSGFTYWLANRLLDLDFIGLPNIIAGREIVPELIQNRANADEIYQQVRDFFRQPYLLKQLRSELRGVKQKLGSTGAVCRVAQLVVKEGKLLK